MKKAKLLVAALTMSVLATGGAVAGCAHQHTYSEDWKNDATGHWHVATCDDLKEGDEAYKKDFAAHVWGDDDECDVCHYTRTPAVTEYTVTLNVGEGTLPSGASTTLTTVNGKLASLPTPTAPNGKKFDGWYTAATQGTKVTADYAFTGETKTVTIYAVYVADTPSFTEYTITLNVGEGTLPSGASTTLTTVNGKLASLPTPTAPNGKKFDGWYTAATQGTKVTTDYAFTGETKTVTIYAVYVDDTPSFTEYTITLNAGEGTLPSGAAAEYKTNAEGKIDLKGADYLPEPAAPAEHWTFDNWYDENDNPVVEATAVFTADTVLTAKYIRDDGVWIGDEFKAALSVNTGCEDHTQYWLGGKKITLDEGTEVSIYLNGKLMTYTVYQQSTCINVPAPADKVTSVTVSKDATFVLYLNDYTQSGGEPDWQVEYTGTALDIKLTNKIPEGCEKIEITVGNGTVQLYLVAPNGTAINSENAANYQVHAWDGPTKLFGEWNDNPTLDGELAIEADIDNTIQWMLHWNGGQSAPFSGIVPDKEYVVKLVTSGDCYVRIYDPTAPDEEEEPEGDPNVDTRDFYILGAGKSPDLAIAWGVNTKLTHEEGTNVYTITLDLYVNDEFKFAINSSWADAQGTEALTTTEHEGEAYLGGSGNIKCLIEGNYTFTLTTNSVLKTGTITWTYNGAVVAPVEETVTHYYIKGSKVTNNWQETKAEEHELKQTAADSGVYSMTIHMEAEDDFMFYSTEVGVDSGNVSKGTATIKASALAAGVTCVTDNSGNLHTTVAGTYTFTYENGKLTVSVVADSVTPDEGGEENPVE